MVSRSSRAEGERGVAYYRVLDVPDHHVEEEEGRIDRRRVSLTREGGSGKDREELVYRTKLPPILRA